MYVTTIVGLLLVSSTITDQPAFDEGAVAWQSNRQLYVDGLGRAEEFRRKLVTAGAEGISEADLLGRALEQFQEKSAAALDGRPDLRQFRISPASLLSQLCAVDQLDAEDCFAPFTGRWYGVWDRMHVDHHWHAVGKRPFPTPAGLPRVIGAQYAWIGDGFGWNYLTSPAVGDSDGTVILGMVYHVEPHQPQRIRLRRPHVAYYVDRGRIIWITEQEVFCEEILPAQGQSPERYAITGFRYLIQNGKLTSRGQAFQAVYGRTDKERMPFFEFPIQVSVSGTALQP